MYRCIGCFSCGYFQFTRSQESSWLAVNNFVVYQQNFAWASGNATEYMFWNVTSLSGNAADIQLSSHGVQITNGFVNIPSAEVNLKVNVKTREVIETSDQSGEMPVGSLFPFWIPQSVKEGDSIQTSYGTSTISPSQTLQIMGQSHDCWLVAYYYSSGNDMNRYYGTNSGICLLIQTHMLSNGVSVSVNETAIQTNIKSL
jgi:hypothetical protein